MKKLVLLLAAIALFSSFAMDDTNCLEVKGSVLSKNKKLDKLQVTLFEDGKEIKKMENQKCPFKLELPRNHYYSLEIKKEGFLPAVIIINTDVPKNKPDCGYHFSFDYEMIAEQNTYNKDYVDYPAAIVKYVRSSDEFIISDKYNTHIKKLIGNDK